jgi:uncharacterized membrane protein
MFNLPVKMSRRIGLILLAIFFIAAGSNHFIHPDFYMAIMPPYLPLHSELVYLSGFFEILGGVAVLFSRLRRWAGYGLIALLIAVFPANIYMAMNADIFADAASDWALYARLPVQFLLICWVFWATGNDRSSD